MMDFVLAALLILASAVACLTQSMPVLKIAPPPTLLSYVTYRYRSVFGFSCFALGAALAARWGLGGAGGWLAPAALGAASLIWASLVVSPSRLFRPVSEGRRLAAKDADTIAEGATVVGVALNGEARAYPADLMQPQHAVADDLGGERIIATWCPLCHSGMVFKGTFKGRHVDPRVIGGGNNNVLLYDPNTKNLIQQITGEILAGPDRGERLEWIGAVTTTWGAWKRENPATTVWWAPLGPLFRRMTRTLALWAPTSIERKQKPFYAMNRPIDRRLRFTELVSGLTVGSERRAYAASAIARHPVINDVVGDLPVAVFSASSATVVRFFDRRVKETVLTFEPDLGPEAADEVVARDRETGTRWSPRGIAVDGPLRGLELREIRGTNRFFWGAFARFYPGASLWEEETAAPEPTPRRSS